MTRAGQVVIALGLGALLGFVFRGLLEAPLRRELASLFDAPSGSFPRASVAGTPAPEPGPEVGEVESSASLRREIEELRGELATQSALRQELQAELEELRREAAAGAEPASGAGAAAAQSRSRAGDATAHLQWLDDALLREAGLSVSEIDALRERLEDIEMERLYLRDEATRDGWLNTPRYHKATHRLNVAFGTLRDDFGDETYDWLLFASGRPNRVMVGGVLENSPAAEAGLKSGDLIIRYDGVRIFDSWALQRATTRGEPGRIVTLEIARGDERSRVYVPRGPLGIRLGEKSVKPGVLR